MKDKTKEQRRKVLLYMRESWNKQDDNTGINSINWQEGLLHQYCTTNGMQIIRAFKEVANGNTIERAGINRLFGFIEENIGVADCVLVASYDRFSRNYDLSLAIIERLQENGLEVLTIQSSSFSNPLNPQL